MKRITTNDNSLTFYNKKYSETYHSTSGAEEEAVKKFVEPSNIKELVNNKDQDNKTINILDICFGLGYNSAAAIDEIREHSKDCIINIIALENDRQILDNIKTINSNFKSYKIIKELINDSLTINKDNTNIKIILKDAKKSVKNIKQKFNIIFLDPFSPKKCPELWTEEFLKDIYALCEKGAILTTYSCARIVRDNLTAAGFKVKDGPCIGRKSPSTIAIKE